MKLVLIHPPAKTVVEKKDIPDYQHIGLGYLASYLENAGIEVKVIDAKLERLSLEKVVEMTLIERPDVIGITAMTHEINQASETAIDIKKHVKAALFVVGGVHVTALPIETLSTYNVFDFGVIGEGELTLYELVEALSQRKRDFSNIDGIVYRNGSSIMVNKERSWIQDLDSLPFPAWHHFPKATVYRINTARGCPFPCVFCMRASGKTQRIRSPENVVSEMEYVIKERKPEEFKFSDETFTLNKNHVNKICDLLIEKNLHKEIKWVPTTRVDVVSFELLDKMKSAGCCGIEFGVESGNEKVLRTTRKNIYLDQARQAIFFAKKVGLHTAAAFILGHPNETFDTAYDTINFAAQLNPDVLQLGIMVPYPGTEVAKMAERGEGGYKILSNNWSDYNKQLGNALELDCLSRADLERLQLIGYLKLFVFNNRFLGLLRFIFFYRLEMCSYIKNVFSRNKKGARNSVITFCKTVQLIVDRRIN
ncbi:MAG: hypothetical protein CMI58_02320 [Parcubacteria group bacterium]|nr:hypothetical protein [Parcubacteria group bacterium]